MLKQPRILALAFSLICFASAGHAESGGLISEVKFGVLAHDVDFLAADNTEKGVDFNGEIVFAALPFLQPRANIRPHVGVQINSDDYTSQVYAGLSATLLEADRFWLVFSGGGAIHNGEEDHPTDKSKAYGSNVLFRLALEAGMDVTEQANVSIYFDHESNANLADPNPGVDNIGMRVGWRF